MAKSAKDAADALAAFAAGKEAEPTDRPQTPAPPQARPSAKTLPRAKQNVPPQRPSAPTARPAGEPKTGRPGSPPANLPLPSAPRPSLPRTSRASKPLPRLADEVSVETVAQADPPEATAARPRSRRPGGARREPPEVRAARTTIPTCLVLAALLPVLAVGWLLLPNVSPLKVGGVWAVPALLAFALACGGAAAYLMRRVALHYD